MSKNEKGFFLLGVLLGLLGSVFSNIWITTYFRIIDGQPSDVKIFLASFIGFIIMVILLMYMLGSDQPIFEKK